MTNKKARQLWEDALIHGTNKDIFKKLKIDEKAAKFFMSHTMPEMFVDKELNRVNLSKILELKKEDKRIVSIIETKESSNLIIIISLFFYFISVTSILVAIVYLKYFF